MEEFVLKLENKEDMVNILVSLIKSQVYSMTVNEAVTDLTARVLLQVNKVVTQEELAEILNNSK